MTRQAQPPIIIGRVVRPHGIVGEIKVHLAAEYASALDGVKHIYLDNSDQPRRVLACRIHQGSALLKLDRVTTRNEAEALRGARVSIHPKDLPKLPESEYYTHDLIGLQVRRESGEVLGELTDVLATGSNDVYVVRTARGELLLPALDSVVQSVDVSAGVMTVAVPDGLE